MENEKTAIDPGKIQGRRPKNDKSYSMKVWTTFVMMCMVMALLVPNVQAGNCALTVDVKTVNL